MQAVALVRATLGLALVSAASAAIAGTWIDKHGRVLRLQALGLTEATLTPGMRTATEAAAVFKTMCLDTNLDRAAAGEVAEVAGFRYIAASIPFNQPVDVGSWVAADSELTVARGMFFAKEPQCNLVVVLPGAVEGPAATTALSALIGNPANAAKATKKDGSLNKRWQPEWVVPGAAVGFERRVFLHPNQPNRIQFAVIARKGP